MAKILVALDGSPGSEKALTAAVKLAQQNGGQLTAVSVLERVGDPYLERLAENVKKKTRLHLEDILQAAGNYARSRGVQLTPILREGHAAATILSSAEHENADLLVLCSHKECGPRAGLGATADLVSDHAHCTVMIVK